MGTPSTKLSEYLASSPEPKQVLVTVKASHQPQTEGLDRDALYPEFVKAAELNYADVIRVLEDERQHDDRVQFNPIGMFNQVSVSAPPDIVAKIAAHPDVAEVVPDEPTQVIDLITDSGDGGPDF